MKWSDLKHTLNDFNYNKYGNAIPMAKISVGTPFPLETLVLSVYLCRVSWIDFIGAAPPARSDYTGP